ncbi:MULTISPECIES: hypothetical protein [unclassified Vibrio]|nr:MULTISPECIES: hypothetical protein [unclassified Vibrio]
MLKSKGVCRLAAAILFIPSFATWAQSLTLATWNVEFQHTIS